MRTSVASLAIAALLSLGVTTGCRSLVPFTQELRDQNRLTEAEIKNLQFYTSSTVTLRREAESGGRQVTGNHKLVMIAGKSIEEVLIPEKTPGICVGVGPHSLKISFEQGTSIDFAPLGTRSYATEAAFATPPDMDPFPGNKTPGFEGAPSSVFAGGYMIWSSQSSQVRFMGKVFDAVDDSNNATLLIDAESLDQVVKRRTVLPGLRLSNK